MGGGVYSKRKGGPKILHFFKKWRGRKSCENFYPPHLYTITTPSRSIIWVRGVQLTRYTLLPSPSFSKNANFVPNTRLFPWSYSANGGDQILTHLTLDQNRGKNAKFLPQTHLSPWPYSMSFRVQILPKSTKAHPLKSAKNFSKNRFIYWVVLDEFGGPILCKIHIGSFTI